MVEIVTVVENLDTWQETVETRKLQNKKGDWNIEKVRIVDEIVI